MLCKKLFSCGKSLQLSHEDCREETACPYPRSLRTIRRKEYPLLQSTTYLDHAGTTTYPKSLMSEFEKEMNSSIFGNPHSHSPSSELSSHHIETARTEALRFFKADPEHFDMIFVANASAAIKLVMDCISDYSHDQGGFWYGYHADAHSSLVGVRQVASRGSRCFPTDQDVVEWLSARETSPSQPPNEDSQTVGLFAYPGQSNMNGRRLPLSWPQRIRLSAKGSGEIFSMLDAAALVSTAPLDLSDHENAPDFTSLSFYKIFGFPDLGALIVRKAAGHVLTSRRYFGGGTVEMIIDGDVGGSSHEDWYAKKATSLHEMLEDGTPAFHSIAALKIAMEVHRKLYGSMINVTKYTSALAKVAYDGMSNLCHANGIPLCQIYTDSSPQYGNSKTQGPTIAFNVQDSRGNWIGKTDFETLAILNNIQLRTGGLCNPGGIAKCLDITPSQMRENFEEGVRCGNEIDEMHGKPTGVIRISFGAMSTDEDVFVFLKFLQLFVDKNTAQTQGVMTPGSEEYTEKVSRHPLSQDSKFSYGVSEETHLIMVCPIAVCKKTLTSKKDLTKHLATHKPREKRRHLWSFS